MNATPQTLSMRGHTNMSPQPAAGTATNTQWTSELDDIIREVYGTTSMKARRDSRQRHIKALAPFSLYACFKRAIRIGALYPLKTKGKPWEKAELEILERAAHCPVATIKTRLERKGYRRSYPAIIKRRLEMIGTGTEIRLSTGHYSATQAAELIGSTSAQICSYIRRGMLKAVKTGDLRTSDYDITAAELRLFVLNHTVYVNPKRIDIYSFVDLLCPSHGRKGGQEDQ